LAFLTFIRLLFSRLLDLIRLTNKPILALPTVLDVLALNNGSNDGVKTLGILLVTLTP
jgi:hypothetical protein